MKRKLILLLTLCCVLCFALSSLTACSLQEKLMPKQNTESFAFVINEDNASYSVRGLGTISDRDIVIPATYKGKPVTGIADYAFEKCTYLTSVIIPDRIIYIGEDAFRDCSSLSSVTIGESVTSIGSSAFDSCSSLTSVTIGDSVTYIGERAFYNCSSLTSITIPFVGATKNGTSNTHFGYIFGASSYSYNNGYVPSSLKTVVITGGSSIGSSAFDSCSSLTSVTIPDSVTFIGDSAFLYCSSLTSITIPDSVTSIASSAFYECSKLKYIYCQAESKPNGWHNSWTYGCSAQVVWGYDGE